MTDFVYSGGVRFDDEAVADVTMDKDGHPLTCKNPITGEELGGGGSSDFSTAEVTLSGSIGFSGSYLFGTPADLSNNFLSAELSLNPSNPTRTIILYKGHGTVALQNANITVSGDAEIIQVDVGGQTIPCIDITGNCTITPSE